MEKIIYDNLVELAIKGESDLRLRPICDGDTDNIIRWRNSDLVKSQFIFREPLTYEIHRKWLDEKVYTGNVIQYIIVDDGVPIGSVYIRDIDLKNESGEFGIFIGDFSKQGKGVGTSITRAFVSYCFNLGFHRVFLRVLSDNKRAISCYNKAGFRMEGKAKDMVVIDGSRVDVIFMASLSD